jgi:hypothetical protein
LQCNWKSRLWRHKRRGQGIIWSWLSFEIEWYSATSGILLLHSAHHQLSLLGQTWKNLWCFCSIFCQKNQHNRSDNKKNKIIFGLSKLKKLFGHALFRKNEKTSQKPR